MIAPDELLSWTETQIEDEIRRIAPVDSELVCDWREGGWSARLERSSEQGSAVLQASLHVDRRMALYDVYGHLWLERQPRSPGASVWDTSAARPTTASVSRYVQAKYRDPEDLDPAEVAAVYGIPPSEGRN